MVNPLLKSTLIFGTLVGVSGAGYTTYTILRTPTYAKVFSGTLLTTTDDSHINNWKTRLATLKTSSELVEKLISLKTKQGDDVWKELRDWCKDIIDNSSKGEEDKEFLNIQNYCTFSVKEKLGNNVIGESTTDGADSKWEKAKTKLDNIPESDLDEELRKVKSGSEPKTTIKTWCTETYKKPYKGDNDKDFKNASKICVTN